MRLKYILENIHENISELPVVRHPASLISAYLPYHSTIFFIMITSAPLDGLTG